MRGTYLNAFPASETVFRTHRSRRLSAHQGFVRNISLDIKRRDREICSLQLQQTFFSEAAGNAKVRLIRPAHSHGQCRRAIAMLADESPCGQRRKAQFNRRIAQLYQCIFVIPVPVNHSQYNRSIRPFQAFHALQSNRSHPSAIYRSGKYGQRTVDFNRRSAFVQSQVSLDTSFHADALTNGTGYFF